MKSFAAFKTQLVLVLALTTFANRPASAQEKPPTVINIEVETSQKLPEGRSIQVLMKKDKDGPANVILVNEATATPSDMYAAVEIVRRIRSQYGDTIPQNLAFSPKSTSAVADSHSDEKSYAYRYLNGLKTEKNTRTSLTGSKEEGVKAIGLHINALPADKVKDLPPLPKKG